MSKSYLHVLAVTCMCMSIAFNATGQKTVYGYTMLPATSPAMVSFTTDDPSTVTRMGTYSKAEPRSGALVGSTLYMMGIDDDFNMWFYSMSTEGGDGERGRHCRLDIRCADAPRRGQRAGFVVR